MPIYEYHCGSCGEDLEILVRVATDGKQCPECGSEDLSKRFSVFGMKSGSRFKSSAAGSSCSGCASHNCGGCNH